jgi:glycosyltransferase involved in cell wall biosynthesis
MDFIEEANRGPDCEMRAYFLWEKEINRDWRLNIDRELIFIADFSYNPSHYLDFYKYFISFSPDIILIGGYKLPLSSFAMILAKLKSRKVIFWLERPFESNGLRGWFKYFYIKNKLKFADGILGIGISATDIYKKFNSKVFNFPYSMNLDEFYKIKRFIIKKDKISFLFSGQLIDRKNIIVLVNVFKSIENDNIRLSIIGSGELEDEIKTLIKNDRRIRLLGFVQPENLPKVYAENDVFVFPSKYDGWGLVINEAMASAMPIIGSKKVGAVEDFIKHKENGFVCDSGEQSIREGLVYYSENLDLVLRHGKKNREIIRNSLGDVRNSVKYLAGLLKNI